ncbi:flagellar basal body rod protein FlgC [Candidatus Formimonas warabiya]|uniref:Flagellar basal-body rod protein FlgC n=1 Tax=Formimonas warabiya TaxID=1761012 RepID=A0A3G1KT74_FORW1|nr:flagellar basal body rod protein FlgC [Candidatus Formimonas warabiya]ATW25668.1 flagellar basal body rod protein FlgC [Candidatus Formimonas warabiya]
MKIYQIMAISASALTAEKLRLDTIANNIANINTTRTREGGPFQRKIVVFEEMLEKQSPEGIGKEVGQGVRVKEIVADDKTPFKLVKDPAHPDADQNGNVLYPNVDLSTEMIDMLTSLRAYQSNVAVLNTTRAMAEKALEINRS